MMSFFNALSQRIEKKQSTSSDPCTCPCPKCGYKWTGKRKTDSSWWRMSFSLRAIHLRHNALLSIRIFPYSTKRVGLPWSLPTYPQTSLLLSLALCNLNTAVSVRKLSDGGWCFRVGLSHHSENRDVHCGLGQLSPIPNRISGGRLRTHRTRFFADS